MNNKVIVQIDVDGKEVSLLPFKADYTTSAGNITASR